MPVQITMASLQKARCVWGAALAALLLAGCASTEPALLALHPRTLNEVMPVLSAGGHRPTIALALGLC